MLTASSRLWWTYCVLLFSVHKTSILIIPYGRRSFNYRCLINNLIINQCTTGIFPWRKKNDTALVFTRTEQLVEKLKRKKEYEAVTHPLSRIVDEEWNTRECLSFFPSCRNLGDVLSLKKAEHWYGHETCCTRDVLPPEVLGRQCCVLKMGSRKAWEEACELLYQKYSKWYLAPVSFPQAALLLLTLPSWSAVQVTVA